MDVGNLTFDSSAFSKFSLYIWKFSVQILLKPSLKNFKDYLASMWNEDSCALIWAVFGIALLWHWNENWLFQSCGHYWVFQMCWHIECSTSTESSFRIWNSSAGIPSPLLALFVVMLPKHHLISDSQHIWLSHHCSPFLYSFSVSSCHLFLISSASVRSLTFLSFILPIFAWNVPLVSLVFLKRSLVFPSIVFRLFSSISLHCSLKKAFLSLLAVLWTLHPVGCIFPFFLCLSLFFFPVVICKVLSDNHLAFLHFFFFGMALVTASCTMLWTSVHTSSGTLSDLIP